MNVKPIITAEELVYDVATELGLTELEQDTMDALYLAEELLVSLRIKLKRHAGREQAVARAIAHLGRFLEDGAGAGDRRDLERARSELEAALRLTAGG